MTEPSDIDFAATLAAAEQEAFAALVASTFSEVGRSAFLGRNPGVVNAWTFAFTTPPDSAVPSFWSADDLLALPWMAEASCQFASRDRAQAWSMQMIGATPLLPADGVLQLLRVRSVGPVEWSLIASQNASVDRPAIVWTAEVSFDAVFRTGGKQRGE